MALTEPYIALDVTAEDAKEAIIRAGDLLVKENKVEPRYVHEMVKGYESVGPYIVVAPGIAIPHARPEHGVKETCCSFVRLKSPVTFGHPTNDPVEFVCAIGGTDSESHIGMLQSLAAVLGDPEKIRRLKECTTKQDVIDLFENEGDIS